MNKVLLFSWILLWPSCLAPAIMATEAAGQDEEPVASGTSFFQPKENVDTHLTMAEQMHQMQQMMGAIMNKFQKWEAEHDQTVAAESENESVGDSPARGGLNKALELTHWTLPGMRNLTVNWTLTLTVNFVWPFPKPKRVVWRWIC